MGTTRNIERCIEMATSRGRRLALSLVGNVSDADDVVQQTLLVVTTKAHEIPRFNAWPWLAKVIAHEARNHRRRVATRVEFAATVIHAAAHGAHDPNLSPSIAAGSHIADSSPLDEVLRRELSDRLWLAFHALPLEEREALAALYVGGLTQRGAAAALGIPRAKLRRLANAGMEQLRRELGVESSKVLSAGIAGMFAIGPTTGLVTGIASAGVSTSASVGATGVISGAIGVVIMKKNVAVIAVVLVLMAAVGGVLWWQWSDDDRLLPAATTAPAYTNPTQPDQRHATPSPPVHAPQADPIDNAAPTTDPATSSDLSPVEAKQPTSAPTPATPPKPNAPNTDTFTFRTSPVVNSPATLRMADQAKTFHHILPDVEVRYSIALPSNPFRNHRGTIEFEGFQPVFFDIQIPSGGTYDGGTIPLTKTITVVGRVVLGNGSGVANAKVSVGKTARANPYSHQYLAMATLENGLWNTWPIGNSDAEGWFSVANLPLQPFAITAAVDGLAPHPAYFTPGSRQYTRDTPLFIVMTPGGELIGDVSGLTPAMLDAAKEALVRDLAGPQPYPHDIDRVRKSLGTDWLSVKVIPVADPGSWQVKSGIGNRIDPTVNNVIQAPLVNSRYRSPSLAPGTYYASLTVGAETEVRQVEVYEGRNTRVDWAFGRTGTIQGKVTRRDGSAVVGGTVYAVRVEAFVSMMNQKWRLRAADTTSDANGRYSLDVGPGHWEIRVKEFEHSITHDFVPVYGATVQIGQVATCDVALKVAQEIPVRVRIGSPSDLEVSITSVNGPNFPHFHLEGEKSPSRNAEGEFDLGLRVPGTYILITRIKGTERRAQQVQGPRLELVVPEGVSEYRTEFHINRNPTVGEVVDSDGKALSGVKISVEKINNLANLAYESATTNPNGEFRFDWLADGEYRFIASAAGMASASLNVTLPHDGRIRVVAGGAVGSVLVRVVSHTGTPLVTHQGIGHATAYLPDGKLCSQLRQGRSLDRFGPVGSTYPLADIPVGRIRVQVFVQGFNTQSHWVEVTANQTSELDVTLSPAAVVKVWLPEGDYNDQQVREGFIAYPDPTHDPEIQGNRSRPVIKTAFKLLNRDFETGRWYLAVVVPSTAAADFSASMPGYLPASWQVVLSPGVVNETTVPLVPLPSAPPSDKPE